MTARASAATSRSPTPARRRRRRAPTQQQVDDGQRAVRAPTSRTRPTSCSPATRQFVAAYKAGDDDAGARALPAARVHWERIEPVAESFGDLDPEMDLREADLEQGQKWTGWHRIEKDLWPPSRRLHRR